MLLLLLLLLLLLQMLVVMHWLMLGPCHSLVNPQIEGCCFQSRCCCW
jgi:hypothetical protein